MTKKLKIDRLECAYADIGSERICYVLGPIPMEEEQLGQWAERFGYNLVIISGMDWDNDLTPWPASGVMPRDAPFKGDAAKFLALLRDKVMPEVERTLKMPPAAERTLIGISLSGLFALWAWMQGDDFTDIGSLSGSFWYDGFADWVCRLEKPHKQGRAFFLLGDAERKSSIRRFQSVEESTERIVVSLREAGIEADFRLVPGTHFAPIEPRMEIALEALSNGRPLKQKN